MDWFGFDVPPRYYEIDANVTTQTAGLSAGWWLALVPVALLIVLVAVAVIRSRRRRSFWCALAEREVVTEWRHGQVYSCTAFETPTAITCARRCTEGAFRRQWPPALPVVMRPPESSRRAA
jgi:hypothetical protein